MPNVEAGKVTQKVETPVVKPPVAPRREVKPRKEAPAVPMRIDLNNDEVWIFNQIFHIDNEFIFKEFKSVIDGDSSSNNTVYNDVINKTPEPKVSSQSKDSFNCTVYVNLILRD